MLKKLWKDVEAKVNSIKGLTHIKEGEYLFNKVKQSPEDAIIVEAGSFLGRSSVTMGYGCMGTHRRLYCIDIWKGKSISFPLESYFPVWEKNIKICGLGEYIIPLCGYSNIVLSQWKELTGNIQIDFVFIDCSHEYNDVLKDFILVYPLLKIGGWIAFHDVEEGHPGCYKMWHDVVKHILSNHQKCLNIACGQKVKEVYFERN